MSAEENRAEKKAVRLRVGQKPARKRLQELPVKFNTQQDAIDCDGFFVDNYTDQSWTIAWKPDDGLVWEEDGIAPGTPDNPSYYQLNFGLGLWDVVIFNLYLTYFDAVFNEVPGELVFYWAIE
jgi:hypothetical protein